MGIIFPSCLKYCADEGERALDQDTKRKATYAFGLVANSGLIIDHYVPNFHKPIAYVAIALAMNCSLNERMKKRVEVAQEFVHRKNTLMLPHVRAHLVVEDEEVRTQIHSFREAMKKLGHTVHVKGLTCAMT
ncbi:hypothetical protein BJX99DRAFT_255245 [Aspergillus californicus]